MPHRLGKPQHGKVQEKRLETTLDQTQDLIQGDCEFIAGFCEAVQTKAII